MSGGAASDADAGPRDAGGPPDLSADAAANLERRADYRDPSAALLSKAEERMLRAVGGLLCFLSGSVRQGYHTPVQP